MTAWSTTVVTLWQNPISVLILMILLERLLHWSASWHPLSIFRLFSQQLQLRVLHPQRDRPSQQLTAGIVATLLLLTLVVLPPWWLIAISDFPHELGAFILLISLYSAPQRQFIHSIHNQLKRGQKNAARALLGRFDQRDVNNLSPIGICRASLDNHLWAWLQLTLTISLCYLVGGPLLALAVRIIMQLHDDWPTEKQRFRYFAQPVLRLQQLATFVPACGLASLFLLLNFCVRGTAFVRQLRQQSWLHWWLPQGLYLFALQQLFNLPSGGPVQYRGKRVRRARFGGQHDSDPAAAVKRGVRFFQIATGLWLVVLALLLSL